MRARRDRLARAWWTRCPEWVAPTRARRELINEIIDIDRGLAQLSNRGDWESLQCPVATLRKAMDSRLCKAMNLLYGDEEDS